MRLVRARYKKLTEMPKVELCCQRMIDIATEEINKGKVLYIDLDDVATYPSGGHCGPPLNYRPAPRVITNNRKAGRVPFEVIDIDEGVQI